MMNAKQAFEFLDSRLPAACDIYIEHSEHRAFHSGAEGTYGYVKVQHRADNGSETIRILQTQSDDFEPVARAALDQIKNLLVAMQTPAPTKDPLDRSDEFRASCKLSELGLGGAR